MAKRGKVRTKAPRPAEERPVRLRRYQYLFLIVCEDRKTEPAYFSRFQEQIPPETMFLKAVGTGRDAKGVVERTLEERNALATEANREVDVTWAVFDTDQANVDPAVARRFQDALALANRHRIKTAYSNESFELWLLLHLMEVDGKTPMHRTEIFQLLEEAIRAFPDYRQFNYRHGSTDILEAVNTLGDYEKACSRAENLLQNHNCPPLLANPSTKVHHLVMELTGWVEYYRFEK